MLQAGRPLTRVPDEVNFFNLPNPSSRTMALRSTQSLTEMSTRNVLGVKDGRSVRLTTLPLSASECLKMCEPQPRATLWASTACIEKYLPLT
jgi:hypothetical protein